MLAERNTVEMVAKHWELSTRTVRRLIAEGDLSCLKIGGAVRITREQVLEYETRCVRRNTPSMASKVVSTDRLRQAGLQRAAKKEQQRKYDQAAKDAAALLAPVKRERS